MWRECKYHAHFTSGQQKIQIDILKKELKQQSLIKTGIDTELKLTSRVTKM